MPHPGLAARGDRWKPAEGYLHSFSDHDFGTSPSVQVVSMKLTLKSYFGLRTKSIIDGGKVIHHDKFCFPLSERITPIAILSLPRVPDSAIRHETSSPEDLPSSSSEPAAAFTVFTDGTGPVNPKATTVGPEAEATRVSEDTTNVVQPKMHAEKTSASAPQEPPAATDSVPLNLGTHVGLFLGSSTSIRCGCLGPRHQIFPTFSTYNAFVTYSLA